MNENLRTCRFEHNESQSGRTMLEMLGVLGIMGIIMYGAIAGINYGMSTYKINQAYNEVQEAIQGIQDLYSWSRPNDRYASVNTAGRMCDNDIFPNCSGGNPMGPFNDQAITVSPFGSDNSSFKITYAMIPQNECQRLKEMEWGTVVMSSACSSPSDSVDFCPKERSCQTTCDTNSTTGHKCT